jgi:hypothetical protein
MKKGILIILVVLYHSVNAQIVKSYNYNGSSTFRSGTYGAYHPNQNFYYTAAEKAFDNHTETILTKIDAQGNTIWYASTNHFGINSTFNSIGDILVTNDNIFVSAYLFPTLATATLNIYKYDHNGGLLDSIVISPSVGLRRAKGDMSFDAGGNIFTVIKDATDNLWYCKVNPITMDLIDMVAIGHSIAASTTSERSMFTNVSGTNSVISYNSIDSIKFITLDPSGNIIGNNYVLSTNGLATDVEYNGTNYAILINSEFSPFFLSTDNPLRIMTLNSSFALSSDIVYPVTKATVFTNLAVDVNGDIFVSGRDGGLNIPGGSILKVSGGTLVYEYPLEKSNFTEVDIEGNKLVLSGQFADYTMDCSSDSHGQVMLIQPKDSPLNFQVPEVNSVLTINNIHANISYNSNNFISPSSVAGYTVDGTGSTIYSSGLLIAGTDISSNIFAACGTWSNIFAAGPVTNNLDYTRTERDNWERVWKIERAQIDAHIQAHLIGDVSYLTPEVILNWPANGDPAKGQSGKVAQFQDLNNNTIYEPLLGEYPLIKGDFCILSIYNDVNGDTAQVCNPFSSRMNIEVYEYVYGFDCSNDSALQNTLFIHYMIIHKSTGTLYNTYVGNFIDHDIQTANDDFISSDPVRGIFYARNGDGSGPEQAYLILGSTSDNDGLDNASGINVGESPNGFGYSDMLIDNERLGMTNFVYYNIGGGPNGDPGSPGHFYNYMQSVWQNGAHVLYGGNGYDVGTTTIESNFMFPGDADNALWYSTNGIDPGADWSEEIVGNPVGDRRGIASSGPFTYLPYDTLFFDVAHVSGVANITAGYTNHEAMINHVDSVRSFFALDSLPCGQDFDFYAPFDGIYPYIGITETEKISPILFPNPTSGNLTITGLPANAQISVYNLTGQLITDVQVKSNAVNFDYTELPRGIYFVRVQSESYSGTIKFVKQ